MISTIDYYTTLRKQKNTCINAQVTLIQNVTTADTEKATYTFLQNVQELKKSRHTTSY